MIGVKQRKTITQNGSVTSNLKLYKIKYFLRFILNKPGFGSNIFEVGPQIQSLMIDTCLPTWTGPDWPITGHNCQPIKP